MVQSASIFCIFLVFQHFFLYILRGCKLSEESLDLRGDLLTSKMCVLRWSLVVFGDLCRSLAIFGNLLRSLTKFGDLWQPLAIFLCQYLLIYSDLWCFLANFSNLIQASSIIEITGNILKLIEMEKKFPKKKWYGDRGNGISIRCNRFLVLFVYSFQSIGPLGRCFL